MILSHPTSSRFCTRSSNANCIISWKHPKIHFHWRWINSTTRIVKHIFYTQNICSSIVGNKQSGNFSIVSQNLKLETSSPNLIIQCCIEFLLVEFQMKFSFTINFFFGESNERNHFFYCRVEEKRIKTVENSTDRDQPTKERTAKFTSFSFFFTLNISQWNFFSDRRKLRLERREESWNV